MAEVELELPRALHELARAVEAWDRHPNTWGARCEAAWQRVARCTGTDATVLRRWYANLRRDGYGPVDALRPMGLIPPGR